MSSSCIFFAVKVDEVTSTLTPKKSMKTTFSSDKIYYNFSQKNPKITDV